MHEKIKSKGKIGSAEPVAPSAPRPLSNAKKEALKKSKTRQICIVP